MKKPVQLVAILLLAIAPLLQAEQMKLFGNIEVHYSLISTKFLPENVAKAYGITRARDRMLLNIAVRERLEDQSRAQTRALKAKLSGIRSDLIKNYELEFQEINEGSAIYYLNEFRFINREIARFDIRVDVEGHDAMQLEFTKTLYFDDD